MREGPCPPPLWSRGRCAGRLGVWGSRAERRPRGKAVWFGGKSPVAEFLHLPVFPEHPHVSGAGTESALWSWRRGALS